MHLRMLALALAPAALNAQIIQTGRDSVITVSAARTSRVTADRASLYVIVEGTAETATDAVARVETKLGGVSDALKKLGALVDVSTSGSPSFQQPSYLSFDTRFAAQAASPEVVITTQVTVRYRLLR